jgi:micrococcal nuclease
MIEAALLCLVVGISDGDTLRKAQPFGQRSKELLSTLCFQKHAEIRPSTRDRYGRTVARVICAGTDANAAMVRAGMA